MALPGAMDVPPDFTGAILGSGGRYRTVRVIGRGGMGTVYEGIQQDLGRRVAIKILHPHLALNLDTVERFKREAQATAALGHPNIVQVTDCQWQPGGPLFLVMEFLTGTSLGQVMQAHGRLPARRVAFIASQLLDALAVAHRSGIVHRDIKPDNVFLTSMAQVHDIVKVLDFGVAKLLGEGPDAQLTSTGVAIGTPFYMAPEQARGLPVDARTDIYAVGVCMYHALSGRVPFNAPSFNALMFAIAEQTPAPLASLAPDVDPGLVAIVERAMAKDPARRFANAGEMSGALMPWSMPTTTVSVMPMTPYAPDPTAPTVAAYTPTHISGRPPMTHPPGSRSSRSGAWVVAGSAALIVVVVAIAIANLLIAQHRRPPPQAARADAAPSAVPSTSATGGAASAGGATAIDPMVDGGKLAIRADGGRALALTADAGANADADAPHAVPAGARQIHATFFSTNNCCEIATLRSAVGTQSGAFTGCANAGQPKDKFPMYDLHVTAAGGVTSVVVLGSITAGDGPFHACMQGALRRVFIGATQPKCDGSVVRVGFNAE